MNFLYLWIAVAMLFYWFDVQRQRVAVIVQPASYARMFWQSYRGTLLTPLWSLTKAFYVIVALVFAFRAFRL